MSHSFSNQSRPSKQMDEIYQEFDDDLDSLIPGLSKSSLFGKTQSVSQMQVNSSTNHLLKVKHQMELSDLRQKYADKEKTVVQKNIELEKQQHILTQKLTQLEKKYNELQIKRSQNYSNLHNLEDVTSELLKKNQKVNMLNQELIRLKNQKNSIVEDLESKIKELDEEKLHYLSKVKKLESEKKKISLDFEEAQVKIDYYKPLVEKSTNLRNINEELNGVLTEKEVQIAKLKQQLNDVEYTENMKKNFENEFKRLKEYESSRKEFDESQQAVKKHNENVAILKEKIILLENDLAASRKRNYELDSIKAVNSGLLEEITKLKQKQQEFISVESLRKQNEDLDALNIKLSKDKLLLEKELAAFQQERCDGRKQSNLLKTEISKKNSKNHRYEEQLLRWRKKYEIVDNEKNSLRAILQSYDTDLTTTTHHLQLQQRLKTLNEANLKQSSYVEELENKLNTLQTSNEDIILGDSNSVCIKKLEDMTKENEELKTKIKSQNDKIENLQNSLEFNKLQGDYNPDSTKVIHFKMNPVDEKREENRKKNEQIYQENLRLKKKLREVEQGHEVSMSEVMVSRKAKEELELAHCRTEKYKDLLIKRNKELTQAVYSLFGWSIETPSERQVKILSMYAESKDDFLMFEVGDMAGYYDLVESEFSKQKFVMELIDTHLHQQRSIPIFLSAVQIQLFSEQTMF